MSSGGEVSTKFSADGEQQVVGAVKRVSDALRTFANKEIKLQTTPVDDLIKKLGTLDAAFKKDLLTQEQYNAAVKRAQTAQVNAKIDKGSGISATDRLASETKKLDAALKAGILTQKQYADAAKTAQDQYQRELDQTQEKLTRLHGISNATAGNAASRWSGVGSAITTAFSAGSAASTKFFQQIQHDSEEAAQKVEAAGKPAGRLAQIGDEASQRENIRLAKDFFSSGATESLGEAYATIKNLSDAKALGDLAMWKDLQSTGLISDVGAFTVSSRQLETTLGGEAAGSQKLALAQSLAAAEPATTSIEQLNTVAAAAGTAATSMGIVSSELKAAASLAIKSKQGRAQELFPSFMGKLATMPDELGATLDETISNISALKLDTVGLKEKFGDATAVDMFRVFERNQDELRGLTKTTSEAKESLVDERIAQQFRIPEVAIPSVAARERNRAELSTELRGQAALLGGAVKDNMLGMIERGETHGVLGRVFDTATSPENITPFESPMMRSVDASLTKLAFGIARMFPGMDEQIVATGPEVSDSRSRGVVDAVLAERFATAAERQERAAEKMERAADSLSRTGRPQARPDSIGPARREAAVPPE